jgi:hypothetical protein
MSTNAGSLRRWPRLAIDPALIYAFKKTGRIVTAKNKRLLSEEEMAEWEDAIDEYRLEVDSGEIVWWQISDRL